MNLGVLPFVLAVFLISGVSASVFGSEIQQNYTVYTDQTTFFVRGEVCAGYDSSFTEASDAINYALNLLPASGAELKLQPGMYELNAPVRMRDNVLLKGSGRGTKLYVSERNSPGIGILLEKTKGARIENLLVSGQNNKESIAGIVFANSGNCIATGIYCLSFSKYGIWVKNESFLCNISESSFAGNMEANIFFDKHRWGEWGDFVPNTVSNCMIYGGGVGIRGFQTTVLNVVGCSFYQTSGAAISMEEHSYSVLVSGCRTFQIKGDAVYFDASGEINLSSNVFCWHTGHGIVIKNCGWGTITGNEIIDNGSYNPNVKNRSRKLAEFENELSSHYGILLSNARGMNISGNTIFNWPQAGKMKAGIFEDIECYENNFNGNIINYYQEDAIQSHGRGSIESNNITNGDSAYEGKPDEDVIQSFQEEKIKLFIQLMD